VNLSLFAELEHLKKKETKKRKRIPIQKVVAHERILSRTGKIKQNLAGGTLRLLCECARPKPAAMLRESSGTDIHETDIPSNGCSFARRFRASMHILSKDIDFFYVGTGVGLKKWIWMTSF
jgi:hypothetical protein